MKNLKIISAIFTFLVLSFACLGGYKDYSDVSEVILRWRGVPAQEVFRNPDLFRRLLSDGIFANSFAQISHNIDYKNNLTRINVQQWGIEASTPLEAYNWIRNRFQLDYSKRKSDRIKNNNSILKSKSAKVICVEIAQLLVSIELTMGRNARLVMGKTLIGGKKPQIDKKKYGNDDGHAWVQEYDEAGNMIAFLDPMMDVKIFFSPRQYKDIVEHNINISPLSQYRPVLSCNYQECWIHGT